MICISLLLHFPYVFKPFETNKKTCCVIMYRENQRTSLPSNWLVEEPQDPMCQSLPNNQSFSQLPSQLNAGDDRSKLQLPLPMPLTAEHAVSMHNLACDIEYDQKSPTLSASFVLDQDPFARRASLTRAIFNRSNSLVNSIPCSSQMNVANVQKLRASSETLSKCFEKYASLSIEAIDKVNPDEIGWNIPPKKQSKSQNLLKMKSENSFSVLSLNAMLRSAVPVHSRSAASIVHRRSLDEQTYRAALLLHAALPKKPMNRKTIRKAFSKSRSFNSFENQSTSPEYTSDGMGFEMPRKASGGSRKSLLNLPSHPINRSLLSLNIVKQFSEDELRGAYDSRTESAMQETSDTSAENQKRAPKPRLYKKNVKTTGRKLPTPIARGIQTNHTKKQEEVKKRAEAEEEEEQIKYDINAPERENTFVVAQAHEQTEVQGNNFDKCVPQSKSEIEVKIPSNAALQVKRVSREFDSYTESTDPTLKETPRQKVKRLRKTSHRNDARTKSRESLTNIDAVNTVNERPQQFQNVFQKFTSFSSDDDALAVKSADERHTRASIGSDNVFEQPKTQAPRRFSERRSSSLEGLNLYQAQKLLDKKLESGRSTVSINDKPEYFEYDKTFPKHPTKARSSGSFPSIANRALNFPKNQPNGVDCLQMSPKRGLLKKPSNAALNDVPSNSSEYDVRDRGGNGSGRGDVNNSAGNSSRTGAGQQSLSGTSSNRDTYRERSGDRGDQIRSLSDRERDQDDSFNRSMSNTEGTPDDKIGLCICTLSLYAPAEKATFCSTDKIFFILLIVSRWQLK